MAKVPPPAKAASGKGAPPAPDKTVGNLDKAPPTAMINMNFKTSTDFKKEFKSYAAAHGMSMLDLLHEGFSLVKEKRGG